MMYCMPQVGTWVVLYFPDEFENHARITSCVRTNGAQCQDTGEPNNRYFTTEHQKQLAMLPGALSLAAVGNKQSPLKLSMLDDVDGDFLGIKLESPKLVSLYAKGDIEFSSDKRIICTGNNEFAAKQFLVNGNAATLQSELYIKFEFDVYSRNVRINASNLEKFPQIEEYNRKKFWINFGIAFAAAAAIAIVAVVTVGTGPLVVGAIAGGAFAFGAMSVDNWNKGESGSLKDYAVTITAGAVAGAIGNMGGNVISSLFFNTVGNVVGTGLEDVLEDGTINKNGMEYGISTVAGLVGGGFDNGAEKIAKKLVANKLMKQGSTKAAENLAKNFGKKYAKKYAGETVATGTQKYMYTLAKASKMGDKGEAFVTKFVDMSFVNKTAKNTKIKALKREINYYPGKNKGAKERLAQLFADNPKILESACFDQASPLVRAVPSSAGNEASQEASDKLKEKYLSTDDTAYLVRGARVKCSCGSHPRKVNLPEDNGVYINGKPMLTENDAISMVNIMDFGECKPKNQKCISNVKKWRKSKKNLLINDKCAITMKAELYCKNCKGATITVVESGQEE
jgi:hypothetical protein